MYKYITIYLFTPMLTFMGSVERNIWGILKRNKNLYFTIGA